MKLVIYEKPTCTTCRQVNATLKELNISYDKVDYYIEPLDTKKIKELLKKMNAKAVDILRDRDEIYRELELSKKKQTLSEDELIALMVKHPDLIQRPIAEYGDKAILARPSERIKELL